MAKAADDHRVRFDLPRGSVRTGGDERVVLVPSAALDDLVASVGIDAACGFARALGVSVGKRIVARIGSVDAVRAASLETFVTELGHELATGGWGAAGLERWGRAMVVVLDHSPVGEHRLLSALVEGALGVISGGRDLRCALLGGAAPVRILVAGPRTVDRARDWLAAGVPWGEVLTRLQPAPSGGDA